MARYEATVASRRGAADTFDYMATFSNAAQWDPGTLAAEQLDPGPVRAGTRFRLTVAFGGRGMPLTYRITRYQPPREVVLEAANGLLRGTDRIVVGDADGDGDGGGRQRPLRGRGRAARTAALARSAAAPGVRRGGGAGRRRSGPGAR